MYNFEQRIENIKTKHSNGIIEKAKAEERIKTLKEQREAIIAQCNALGVNPESLAAEIENEKQKINKLVVQAERALGITESDDAGDAF